MREIKVRGLVIEPLVSGEKWITSDEEYHEVYLNYAERSAYINGHAVVWESVSEYTGLKDKNGKEIYEGDILDLSLEDDSVLRCEIVYQAPSFCRKWHHANTIRLRQREIEPMAWNTYILYEVIGNIYENKELLKGDE
ncbi:YopX family protein [Bacillus cereus]